ncbi:hypothetical protein [Actinomadura sp. WMMA1423]|uniref:hypothetical protein n=1 Tax=Actinomadura sp. WMMA1423 TaxID=2591108 RepID=UPI0011473ED5|nr:hypothetical protein [Actinomadura sp. WMMA1423]
MRQLRWAHPGHAEDRSAHDAGALQVVDLDGRIFLTGMYCDSDGHNRVDLRDAASGEVIDAHYHYKQWWNAPADHFTGFSGPDGTYILYKRPRGSGYCVKRVTPNGFEFIEDAVPEDDGAFFEVGPAVLDGRLTILTCDERTARFREWRNGDHVLRIWTAPEGWADPSPMSIGGRPCLWLSHDGPEHITRLWDPTSDKPVGPPFLVRGYRWGPWMLNLRPVALFKVDWRDFQLWDLGRREPCGPGLGDLELKNPSVGLIHGRPALAGTVGRALQLWDIPTGRLINATALPDTPIATAIGSTSTAWAVTTTGHIGKLTIKPAEIHPAARGHGANSPPITGETVS